MMLRLLCDVSLRDRASSSVMMVNMAIDLMHLLK